MKMKRSGGWEAAWEVRLRGFPETKRSSNMRKSTGQPFVQCGSIDSWYIFKIMGCCQHPEKAPMPPYPCKAWQLSRGRCWHCPPSFTAWWPVSLSDVLLRAEKRLEGKLVTAERGEREQKAPCNPGTFNSRENPLWRSLTVLKMNENCRVCSSQPLSAKIGQGCFQGCVTVNKQKPEGMNFLMSLNPQELIGQLSKPLQESTVRTQTRKLAAFFPISFPTISKYESQELVWLTGEKKERFPSYP